MQQQSLRWFPTTAYLLHRMTVIAGLLMLIMPNIVEAQLQRGAALPRPPPIT